MIKASSSIQCSFIYKLLINVLIIAFRELQTSRPPSRNGRRPTSRPTSAPPRPSSAPPQSPLAGMSPRYAPSPPVTSQSGPSVSLKGKVQRPKSAKTSISRKPLVAGESLGHILFKLERKRTLLLNLFQWPSSFLGGCPSVCVLRERSHEGDWEQGMQVAFFEEGERDRWQKRGKEQHTNLPSIASWLIVT